MVKPTHWVYMPIHVHVYTWNAEGRGFESHPRQQFFKLPWDLVCVALICLSQVSWSLS